MSFADQMLDVSTAHILAMRQCEAAQRKAGVPASAELSGRDDPTVDGPRLDSVGRQLVHRS